jgi:hypothetical protein
MQRRREPMKKFAAVFAAVLVSAVVISPTFVQTQPPKGTEGPDVRKQEPKSTEGPDVRKQEQKKTQ